MENNKTILFLDIDGVLLPFDSYADLDTRKLLANPMEYIDALAERTPKPNLDAIHKLGEDHTFVLISTWRYLVPDAVIEAYMTKLGLWQFFDKTRPIANFHRQFADKRNDLKKWLKDYHYADNKTDQDNWIVIDDWDMDYDTHQIVTDPWVGYIG